MKPKPTKPDCKIEFDKIWKRYPNKDSRKQSEVNFNKSVKAHNHINQINKALTNYLNMLKTETWRKCKSGSTWFNNWQDWIDYRQDTPKPNEYYKLPEKQVINPSARQRAIQDMANTLGHKFKI